MKSKNSLIAYILILLIVVPFFLVTDCARKPQGKEETIRGTVTAYEVDDEGNAISVAISVEIAIEDTTELELEEMTEDYTVGETEKGLELLELVDQYVEATGRIETDKHGRKTILVENYMLIDVE
jgi:hypothetical protein